MSIMETILEERLKFYENKNCYPSNITLTQEQYKELLESVTQVPINIKAYGEPTVFGMGIDIGKRMCAYVKE